MRCSLQEKMKSWLLLSVICALGWATTAPLAAACCNPTESGCLPQVNPVTEIHQSDIPIWITCSGTYKVMEDLFYDGDTDPANPNPAAAFFGPIGIGINAPDVVLDMNGHTFTAQGFSTNTIMTYDTIDQTGSYIATAHNAVIKNGSVIGNFDQASIGVALLSSDATINNISVEGNDFGFAIDQAVFMLDESDQLVAAIGFHPIKGIVFDGCQAINNGAGILAFADGPTEMTILNSQCANNVAGIVVQPFLNTTTCVIDGCTIANSSQNGIEVAAKLTLTNSYINDSGVNGIAVTGSGLIENVQVTNANASLLSMVASEDFIVKDCIFSNGVGDYPYSLLLIQDSAYAKFHNCSIYSSANTANGCLIDKSIHITFNNCSVDLSGVSEHENGFRLLDATACAIKHCSIENISGNGIQLDATTSECLICENRLKKIKGTPIVNKGKDNKICHNHVKK